MGEAMINASFAEPLVLRNQSIGDLNLTMPSIIACTGLAALIGSMLITPNLGLRALAQIIALLFGTAREAPEVVGCRRLGMTNKKSNLIHDEFHPKYRYGDKDGNEKTWKIKSLWVYPIKSCAGIELTESTVEKTGLRYDRMFSFAQREKGDKGIWTFTTIRSHPLMTKVRTELWEPDPSAAGFSKSLDAVKTKGVVRMIFPNPCSGLLERVVATLRGQVEGPVVVVDLPLQPTREQIDSAYTTEVIKIWNETVQAVNMGSHIPRELVQFLGTVKPNMEFTLFRCHQMRELYRDAPSKEVLGWQPIAGFNDAYPVNLLGLSSLQALDDLQHVERQNALLADRPRDLGIPPKISARRFRANIIVEGTPEFEEETWKYIHLGDEEFYVAARCVRCKLPNVDPDTGVAHKNFPDVATRKHRAVDKGAPKNTGCLAVQMVPKRELGSVQVGAVISVRERGEHIYTPMFK